MIYLETQRLVLRNWEQIDLDELFDYRNDERCTRFQRGQLHERADLAELIRRRSKDDLISEGGKQLAIAMKPTNQLVGEVALCIERPSISMGYTISYKYQRNGYAFEMLSTLIGILHRHYPELEMICRVEPENVASIGLLRKLGYRECGREKETDSLVYRLCLV